MDRSAEIRSFLTSRRARLTPEEAGTPAFAGTCRVPGLRREEVAHAAGVSMDWYTRLERGNVNGVSPEVLGAVSRALRHDAAERAHLFDLFRRRGRPAPVQPAGRQPASRSARSTGGVRFG